MEIIETRQKELPNATAVLILGILSLVLCWFVGLILGIVAVALASKPRLAYYANPNGVLFQESASREDMRHYRNLYRVGCFSFYAFDGTRYHGVKCRINVFARLN